MMAIACIIGLGFLTQFFSGIETQRHNPNQSPPTNIAIDAIEVHLLANKQGHYIVSGTINHRAVEFLLDTGATDVVIPAHLADQLKLQKGRPQQAYTANGTVTVYNTSVDELGIGDITLYNVSASINPGMKSPGILLGMSALRQVELIQRGNALTLRQLF